MALKHVAIVVGPFNIGADMIRLRFLGNDVMRAVIGVLTWQCMLNSVLNDRDRVLVNLVAMVHVSRIMHVTSERWHFVRAEALCSVMMLTGPRISALGFHMFDNVLVMVHLWCGMQLQMSLMELISINFLRILIVEVLWMVNGAFLVRTFDQVLGYSWVDSGARHAGNVMIQAIVSLRSDMF